MASPFVPKGQEGLLLRSPLMYGFSPPKDFLHPKSIYTTVSLHAKVYQKAHVCRNKIGLVRSLRWHRAD